MTERERNVLENIIFQLSRCVRGADNEGTAAVVDGVKEIGWENLASDAREEMLALAEHWGWTDGPEYFASLTKREAA